MYYRACISLVAKQADSILHRLYCSFAPQSYTLYTLQVSWWRCEQNNCRILLQHHLNRGHIQVSTANILGFTCVCVCEEVTCDVPLRAANQTDVWSGRYGDTCVTAPSSAVCVYATHTAGVQFGRCECVWWECVGVYKRGVGVCGCIRGVWVCIREVWECGVYKRCVCVHVRVCMEEVQVCGCV